MVEGGALNFEEFFAAHYDRTRRILAVMLGDPVLAEEATRSFLSGHIADGTGSLEWTVQRAGSSWSASTTLATFSGEAVGIGSRNKWLVPPNRVGAHSSHRVG